MSKYELMLILSVSAGDEGAKTLAKEVEDLLVGAKAKVLEKNSWGRRKLAYKIDNHKEGSYEVWTFETDNTNLTKIKEKLGRKVGLVRYLITAI